MLRPCCFVLVLAATLERVHAGCVRINAQESSGWVGQDGVTKHFQLQVEVLGTWIPFTQIMFRWPGENVEAKDVWNAENMPGVGDGSNVIVRLGRDPVSPPKFVVMGLGTQSISPIIQCNTDQSSNLPPPSPPHADYCPLGPTYTTLRSWMGSGASQAGDNVQISFRSWKDAGMVQLRYWGQIGMSVEGTVGAIVTKTQSQGSDTLITLQLGTSCEDRVIDNDGIVVSQPGQQINCVPHRAETMHVTFNLHPPALHPPQIACIDLTAPQQVGSPDGDAFQPPTSTPTAGGHAEWAPFGRPPLPSPSPPPPPALSVGSSLRSMPDCALGAIAIATSVSKQDATTDVTIEILPDHWLEGYVFILGVTGTGMDLDPSKVHHATLLTPTVDVTGRVLLFGFALEVAPDHSVGEKAAVSFTVRGEGIQLNQLSCRPAPAPPPQGASIQDGSEEKGVVNPVPAGGQREELGFIFMELSGSDLLLVGVAVLLSVALIKKHWRELCGHCGSSDRLPIRAVELPEVD